MMTVHTQNVHSTYTVRAQYVLLKNQSLGCCKGDQWHLENEEKKSLNTNKGRGSGELFDPNGV